MTIVSAIQMGSYPDYQVALTEACQLVVQAKQAGAALAVLPETFLNLQLSAEQTKALASPEFSEHIQSELSQCAKHNDIWLVGGTLPCDANAQKLYSRVFVWDNHGKVAAVYDKIHLFDVDTQTGESYSESKHIQAGEAIVLVETPFGKLGVAVCYDVRFPELFRAMMQRGMELLVLPAAFTIETGKAHWEILLKARAIENLCYVVAAAEVGERKNGVGTFGHSMIIDPWGKTLACLEAGTGVVSAPIDLAKMHKIRKTFPVLSHTQAFVMRSLEEKGEG